MPGHWVTGGSNQVVWGIPDVFAMFLIVSASGALNVAIISSVFGKNALQTAGAAFVPAGDCNAAGRPDDPGARSWPV